jgi:hypothetical protein
MAKEEIEFVDGLIVKAPHEKAPSYVKANISIKVEDLGKWLRGKYKAGDEWVNIDVKEAKSGKWYCAVSTFKPKKAQGGGADEDIPFAPIGKREALIK